MRPKYYIIVTYLSEGQIHPNLVLINAISLKMQWILGAIETIRGPFPNPGQLLTMKSPFPGRGSRSPLHFPLFPISGQRRWSEAAAAEVVVECGDGTMRRWSMPWDCGRAETGPWQQRYLPSKLVVPPTSTSQDRSRSTTPGILEISFDVDERLF